MDTDSNYDGSQHLDDEGVADDGLNRNEKWKNIFEHTLYPSMKKRLLPQKTEEFDSKIFLNVANLPELYKVFERC